MAIRRPSYLQSLGAIVHQQYNRLSGEAICCLYGRLVGYKSAPGFQTMLYADRRKNKQGTVTLDIQGATRFNSRSALAWPEQNSTDICSHARKGVSLGY